MSEEKDEKKSLLPSKIVESAGSPRQDTKAELVMSKSKARSLRRKRAKQRKKAMELQEDKTESHDKENHDTHLTEENKNQESKKKPRKKKPRKKKNKAKVVEGPGTVNTTETLSVAAATKITPNYESKNEKLDTKNIKAQKIPGDSKDVVNATETSSFLEAQRDIPTGLAEAGKFKEKIPENHSLAAAVKVIPNVNFGAEKIKNSTNGSSTTGVEDITSVKKRVEKYEVKGMEEFSSVTTAKYISTTRTGKTKVEKTNELANYKAAPVIQKTFVEETKPNAAPMSYYEDVDESKDRTKENCDCACIIS